MVETPSRTNLSEKDSDTARHCTDDCEEHTRARSRRLEIHVFTRIYEAADLRRAGTAYVCVFT